jgi:taurine transport system ATP-binding protein
MSTLTLDNIGLSYPKAEGGEVTALEDISMSLSGREFVVALGPSGCGKTSLLNIIAGFIPPSTGSIFLDGKPVAGPGRDRGVVFQKHALLPWLNVRENAEFGLKMQGVGKGERRAKAQHFLEIVGLGDFAEQAVYSLSGGMQQRLGLARILAGDPRILLMDEPFGALDALTREGMQELFLKIFAEGKQETAETSIADKTVFFITHSVEEAVFLATKLIIMSPRPGRIHKSFDLGFSTEFMSGGGSRIIKSRADFIETREHILSIVRGLENDPMEQEG